jgi:NAD-dependent deacetylase
MNTSLKIFPTDQVFVLTGAGISAESGIPTFRGSGGLWDGYRAEVLATPEAFAKDPELVWRFYSMRRSVAAGCKPNPGHFALAQFEQRLGNRIVNCTQNVDSLHEAAGSIRTLHMHGELFKSRCSDKRCKSEPFEDRKTYQQRSEIPACNVCGALIRPHICWFGEVPFHMNELLIALKQCTVFLTVGTSGIVEPAASFAKRALNNGARTYYVGPEEPANVEAFQEVFLGPAGERLPELAGSK